MSASIYTYLENSYTDLLVGVDAVTFTAKTSTGLLGMRGALSSLEDQISVNPKKPFKTMGAIGWASGSIRYAERFDRFNRREWAILMVTGKEAQGIVKFFDFDLYCSRVDFRVDVKLKETFKGLAQKCYGVAPKQNQPRFISSLVGDTFYPSSDRSATYYGRVYDKSPEYGMELGNVWRYEVEIKRKSATPVISGLLSAAEKGEGEEFIADTVFGLFSEKWATPVPKVGVVPKMNYVGLGVSSPDAKLDWIRRNVAPTVKFLKRMGYTQELEQLFNA